MSDSEISILPINLYEEDLNNDTACDYSSKNLEQVPQLNNFITVLSLQNNKIKSLPDDFFDSLPNLMWLDLRDNLLTTLPASIQKHQCLTHILLQNNKLTSLPCELGTLPNLKVLQLKGNPLAYPPQDIIDGGTKAIMNFLNGHYMEKLFSDLISEDASSSENCSRLLLAPEMESYNSVVKENDRRTTDNALTIQVSEKDAVDENKAGCSTYKKCPRLPKCRAKSLPPHAQSRKYVKQSKSIGAVKLTHRIKQGIFEQAERERQKELLESREKIIQGRKNIEILRNWRKTYKRDQTLSCHDGKYVMEPRNIPYDTSPEYMTLLSREDIEKELPDKYRRNIARKCRPSVPRHSNKDVQLAMKIKKLFENLESIDLNRDAMTPRTEQKVLMNEIQKISEIKQKLSELSLSNLRSFPN